MQFMYSIFFLAAAGIIGPILAHLLNRSRYRKIPFTMLQFLYASQKQTQSKRRLQDFLILLLRCLIIVLIALLFAGPAIYSQRQRETSKQTHFLLLDDSLSMSCKEGLGSCFDRMTDAARDYLKEHDESNCVFHLYSTTTGCMGKELTAKAAMLKLDTLTIQTGRTDITALLADIQESQSEEGRGDTVHLHCISDFTNEVLAALQRQPKGASVSGFSYDLIADDLNANNLTIRQAQVLGMNEGRLTLTASVINYGSHTSKRLIHAEVNSKFRSEEFLVNPAPGHQQDVVLTLDISELPSSQTSLPVEIKLTPDDDLPADDMFPLAVSIQQDQTKDVLLLGNDADELFLIRSALNALKQSQNSFIGDVDAIAFSRFDPARLASYNMVIASTIDQRLKAGSKKIKQYIKAGGRWVFFTTSALDRQTAQTFYDQQILPAMPEQDVRKTVRPETLNNDTALAQSQEASLLSILSQYKIETVPLWSYYRCAQHPDTAELWQIDTNAALVYQKRLDAGFCALINTSLDDSRSSLIKKPAVLPLIRYLLGVSQQVNSHSFACDETAVIPIAGESSRKEIDYIDAVNEKHTAKLSDGFLRVGPPHGLGWIRILTQPVSYAGIYPVTGETNLKRTFPGHIEKTLAGLFTADSGNQTFRAQTAFGQETVSLEKIFIWVIIGLILLDSFIANRIQRS